jgi:eukaryotic-like serine/threonine-protein kinase
LAKTLWARGDKANALKETRLLEASALKETHPQEMRRAGALAIELGDISAGRKILAQMERLPLLQESHFTQSCYYNLKGVVESAAGQTDSAIESQRRAALFFPTYEPYRALGDEYASRRDWLNAAQAYQRYLGFRGEMLRDDSPSDLVLAHLSLARSLAQAGDSAHSLEQYDEFLRLWGNADPDLQSLREARGERERLNATVHESVVIGGITRAKE